MLFFIYAIIGMQVGESLNLKVVRLLLGYIQTFFLWDKDNDEGEMEKEKENEDDGYGS